MPGGKESTSMCGGRESTSMPGGKVHFHAWWQSPPPCLVVDSVSMPGGRESTSMCGGRVSTSMPGGRESTSMCGGRESISMPGGRVHLHAWWQSPPPCLVAGVRPVCGRCMGRLRIVSYQSLQIGIEVDTLPLPRAWCYGVSAGTVLPGISKL